MERYDFAVIGAGIVGLATAARLAAVHPGADILVLDKESEVGRHQTGHNSGVIHAGIYYPPGSLKADFCKQGAADTKAYCAAHGIPYDEVGKLLVATNPLELERLRALQERASIHGLQARWLDARQLVEEEPHVTGLAALLISSTAIVDYRRVCQSLRDEVAGSGRIELGNAVRGITEGRHTVRLDTDLGERCADRLVVCGGLQADRLARLAGIDTDLRIVPFRGEYFRLPDDKNDFVTRLIYPVPDPELPFLGVHLSPTIQGYITVGPSAVLGLSREGYAKGSVNARDLWDIVSFPGMLPVARANVRNGLREMRNSLFRSAYLREARKYAPSLTVDDLLPAVAGIRAQAVRRDGTMVHDFALHRTDRMLHVLNAPSPAATAAMPIARHIVDQFGEPGAG